MKANTYHSVVAAAETLDSVELVNVIYTLLRRAESMIYEESHGWADSVAWSEAVCTSINDVIDLFEDNVFEVMREETLKENASKK